MAELPNTTDSTEVLWLEECLPPLLAVIAGMVDVIGFLSLGLFTAHITGNLVMVTARLVRGQLPHVGQILAVPVFVIAVAALWWIAKSAEKTRSFPDAAASLDSISAADLRFDFERYS